MTKDKVEKNKSNNDETHVPKIAVSKHTRLFLGISIATSVLSIIFLAVFGLNLAIDFTGGSVFKYELVTENGDRAKILQDTQKAFETNAIRIDSIRFEEDILVVRTAAVPSIKNDELNHVLFNEVQAIKQVAFETVGSVIGYETVKKSFLAVGAALIGILLYITLAFKNIQNPYSSVKFGISAVVAMFHDVLLVLGVFALLGYFFDIEIGFMFVTALLTVIGFSVHDTIVVFDRIRENLRKYRKKFKSFGGIVDVSISETLRRSVFTSLTVLMVLGSLFLFGGDSIKYFVLALIIGIASGTYSSIFVASPVLIKWEGKK